MTAIIATESIAATPTAPPRRSRPSRKQNLVGWSFALPFFAMFVVFMAGPIVVSLITSLTDLRSTDIRSPFGVNFVGFDNYVDVFSDPKFRKAAVNTAIFVVVGVPLTMSLGLLAAVALNQGIVKFRRVFRLGFYLPVVTSIVAIAVVWRFLLGADSGLVNGLLDQVGIDGPAWLTDTKYALPSLIVMAAWKNLGFSMIVFLAALQSIPVDLYEAAAVDGAKSWQPFRYITLPLLRPTILFVSVITTIGYVQFFEEPLVMTQGGPLDATLSVTYHAYNQFSFGNYGYTAAVSYVMFVAIALVSFILFRLLRPNT
ncbi:MAG TPA: sugar ABC transporter permease [Ilumatobacteraceae bacterium]|nr:sugar ABC transporter permease [Ilumatobacteraceae bacterium]